MAIAFDASASSTSTGTGVAWSHTCTGDDLVLVVFITSPSGYTFSASDTMNYDGVAMTFVGNTGDGTRSVGQWYLANPSTGANTVDYVNASGSSVKSGYSLSYTGVNTTSPIDSSNGGTGNSSTPTLTTTVVKSSCWLVGALMGQDASLAAGSGTTERNEQTDADGQLSCSDDSNGTVSTGSQSLNITMGGSRSYAYRVVSIAPKGGFIPQVVFM